MLPPEVEDALSAVKAWQAAVGNRWRRFFNVPANTFVDPNRVHPSLHSAAYRGILGIALASGQVGSQLKAVLLSARDELSQEVLALMRRLRIPAYHGDLRDVSAIRSFLDQEFSLSLGTSAFAGRRPTNPQEHWLLKEMHVDLGLRLRPGVRDRLSQYPALLEFVAAESREQAKRYRVYHEMSVGKLLAVAEASAVASPLAHELKNLRAYRCDAVVATAPPRSLPMIVVEFDGVHHRRSQQWLKDLTRDESLTRAGLAVVRISSETAGIEGADWDKNGPISSEVLRNRRCTENFLWYVIHQLLDHFERVASRSEREALRAARYESAVAREWRVSSTRLGRILTPEEKRAISRRLIMKDIANAESRWDEQVDEALEFAESQSHRERLLNGGLSGQGRVGSGVSDIVVDLHEDGSVCARGIVATGRASRKVSTPRFFVRLRLPEHVATSGIDSSKLRSEAARFALIATA